MPKLSEAGSVCVGRRREPPLVPGRACLRAGRGGTGGVAPPGAAGGE
ncbi:hypothetical protein Hoch_2405 [Haliangium ochraceum DSM 14365]|uniref:Uncharacterized protein n=1 Tax=Haliangium ochraceum (strain DSM 14365 / JCM 11303 / SMP-2) TaxID=502025 RepID=D0LJ95_HALO1|nr:hypothetical protein Hoch_2405 [Haliangium ochraceum DSM 14365]